MGQKLIGVADLSLVWVWAEFYQNEIPIINVGQTVSITFDSDKAFTGVVAVVNPFVSQAQRTTKIRIDLPNPDLQLRPGMYVNAEAMNSRTRLSAIHMSGVRANISMARATHCHPRTAAAR